jgi:hypothetical protein
MAVHGLLYSEADIERLLQDPRFIAAVHGYSLDLYPLGEVAIRWANGRQPRSPRGIEILGYKQLFHEVAERIADGRIEVDDSFVENIAIVTIHKAASLRRKILLPPSC